MQAPKLVFDYDFLRELRKERPLAQREISTALGWGMDRYGLAEREKSPLGVSDLARILTIFHAHRRLPVDVFSRLFPTRGMVDVDLNTGKITE